MTVDTLRADHVGAYGGDVATPHLDRMAAQGALVEQVSAHVPLTRPSHISLFTGRLPFETGVRDNITPSPLPTAPMLAEVLRDAGFSTAAFVSSIVIAGNTGLDRGFGTYGDEFAADPRDPNFLNTAQKRGDESLDLALAWLEENKDAERIFLWLHLYDPHEPYAAPEPFASRYPDRPYAGEVAWSDELLGRLDSALGKVGLREDTLWVVTSDHGEGLGDHGELLHGFFAYESTLRVPLLFRGPGVMPGTRVDQVAALVDLYPTLLDLVGVPRPIGEELSGRSLAAALRGEATPQVDLPPLYAETLVPRLHFGWSDLRVVRQGPWKYIEAPRPELYDLATDPGELHNRVMEERRRAHALRQHLATFRQREEAAQQTLKRLEKTGISRETREQLAALGYVGGAAPSAGSSGADPKDKIEEFRLANALMREGVRQLNDGRFADAAANFQRLLERGIESAEILRHLGRSLLALERAEEAAEAFRGAISSSPAEAAAWRGLAESQLRLGEVDAAMQTLEDARLALPRDLEIHRRRGLLYRRLRRLEPARDAFLEALALAPEDAHLHANLGEALRDLGDSKGALKHLRAAVEFSPQEASYWNALGLNLGGAGELLKAVVAFREACQRAPKNPRYAFNLGLALARQGQAAEAAQQFLQALEIDPGFAAARQELERLGPARGLPIARQR